MKKARVQAKAAKREAANAGLISQLWTKPKAEKAKQKLKSIEAPHREKYGDASRKMRKW